MNNYSIKSILVIAFINFVVLPWAQATQSDFSEENLACQFSFLAKHGKFSVVSSGRDDDVIKLYRDKLIEFYRNGGVAEQLHLTRGDQQHVFVPSDQLAQLATLGRHAVPHWIDGKELINSIQAAGVMEFATQGVACSVCRAAYSDATKPIEQLSIIDHVQGHIHVSGNSSISKNHDYDPIAHSIELAEMMSHFKTEYPSDEVDQWYQYLHSLVGMRDYFDGTIDLPESFTPDHAYDKKTKKRVRFPRNPTLSVIQAIIANLPATAPQWKRDMALTFEKMTRNHSSVPPQKTLNEGFAVLMQKIIPAYSEYNSKAELLAYSRLLAGVLGPRLDYHNPYSFGTAMWEYVKERFEKRPEIVKLSDKERDAAFDDYATTRVIEVMTDRQFIDFAIDEGFIAKHKLFLVKEVAPQHIDRSVPGFDREKHNTQYEVATRDPDLIRNVIKSLTDMRQDMPRIELHNLEASGGRWMHYKSINFRDYPLDLKSAAKTLLVHARTKEQGIVLDTLLYGRPKKDPSRYIMPNAGIYDVGVVEPANVERPILEARIQVTPDGAVKVLTKDKDGQYQKHNDLTKKAKAAIDAYIDETAGTLAEETEQHEQKRLNRLSFEIMDAAIQPAVKVAMHAPSAAAAIDAFRRFGEQRVRRAIRLLKDGKFKFRATGSGIVIRPFPEIPKFRYDRAGISAMNKQQNVSSSSQIDNNYKLIAATGDEIYDDRGRTIAASIGSGDAPIGRKFWGQKPQDGQGEGESEEGEESDDGEPTSKPGDKMGGEGATDPFEVNITFEQLNEILDLELPNRKVRDRGDIATKTTQRRGSVKKANGEIKWTKMMPTILAKGMADLQQKHEETTGDPLSFDPTQFMPEEIMEPGLGLITSEDYIVVSREIVEEPQTNAVLVRIMDQSGSMHGRPQELLKNFYKNMITLLKAKYKKLIVINVGFNHQHALEMTDEQFFGNFMNGADYYKHGWDKGSEILSRPEFQNFDKYGVIAGDFQSPGDPEVIASMKKFNELLNWGAAIQTVVHGDVALRDLIEPVRSEPGNNKWFDYAKLADSGQSQIEILKHFFGKNRKR